MEPLYKTVHHKMVSDIRWLKIGPPQVLYANKNVGCQQSFDKNIGYKKNSLLLFLGQIIGILQSCYNKSYYVNAPVCFFHAG